MASEIEVSKPVTTMAVDDNGIDMMALYDTLPIVRGQFSLSNVDRHGASKVPVPAEIRKTRGNLGHYFPHQPILAEQLPPEYYNGKAISFWVETDPHSRDARHTALEVSQASLKDFCRALRHRYQIPLKISFSTPDLNLPRQARTRTALAVTLMTDEAHRDMLAEKILPALNHSHTVREQLCGEYSDTDSILHPLPPARNLEWQEALHKTQNPNEARIAIEGARDIARFMSRRAEYYGVAENIISLYPQDEEPPVNVIVHPQAPYANPLKHALVLWMDSDFTPGPKHAPSTHTLMSNAEAPQLTAAAQMNDAECKRFSDFCRNIMNIPVITGLIKMKEPHGDESCYIIMTDLPPDEQISALSHIEEALMRFKEQEPQQAQGQYR